jgi:hypothetical protein
VLYLDWGDQFGTYRMKCNSCGGITLRPDASECRHCGATFIDLRQNNDVIEMAVAVRGVDTASVATERSSGGVSQIAFRIALTIWYLPLAIGLLGFFARGFHPEGLRAWLMARNGPMLIFAVGEDPSKVFVLPVVLEFLMLPLLVAFNRFKLLWPLVLLTVVSVMWALLGAAMFALT